MLRLERMEICGFKSFSDRTEIRFPDGITAIVGPNGCGKSNLGDAINWVLGEQSPKMLRGRQMADVIFNGSETRKPLGLAEVTLVFGGAEGLAGGDQGRVTITRRLFRSGESEYRLNGSRTRLMDIQELLRDTKVGARTYATIEQGRIEQVLSAKPKERRALIEDAAGVSGYKHKRRLAELKLEATEANLLRVNDIVGEVQRQIQSLKRQAAKARRYRRLRDELRAAERVRFARQTRDLERELAELRASETAARDDESAAAGRLARLESELLERRETLERLRRDLQQCGEELHRREMEIDRAEGAIRAGRERIAEAETARGQRVEETTTLSRRRDEIEAAREELAREVAEAARELEERAQELERRQRELGDSEGAARRLRGEIERLRTELYEAMSSAAELRNRRRSTEEAIQRSGAQRGRLEAEHAGARDARDRLGERLGELAGELDVQRDAIERLRREHAEGEVALREARERHAQGMEALAAAREQEKTVLGRLATLEDLETRFTGVSDGVKALLVSGASNGIRTHGVVADYVEAHQEIEGAAESYLGWLLPTVVLEDDVDAHRAAQFLRSAGAGRTSLICRTHPAASPAVGEAGNGCGELPAEVRGDRRVLGRLRERLTLKAAGNGSVSERIGDAVLVEDLETALELHRRHPAADYLTRDGDVVYASGMIEAGGHRPGNQGLLAHRRRLELLRGEAAQAAAASAAVQQRVEIGGNDVERRETETAERRAALEAAERRRVELELGHERVREEAERLARQERVLADELAGVDADSDPLQESLRETLVEAGAAEEGQRALEQALGQRQASLEGLEAGLKQHIESVAEARAELAARTQRRASQEQAQRQVSDRRAEVGTRLEALRGEIAAAEERIRAAGEQLQRTEADLAGHLRERDALSQRLGALERESAELAATLQEREAEQRRTREEVERRRERSRDAELARTRAEAAREHLDDLCRQELGLDAGAALAAADAQALEAADAGALEAEIRELRERIERIGPVNMTAIEEFTELEERHAFLGAQRADLQQAMESLRESIRRINRQSRQRFAEAFEAIRRSYQEIYQLLFSGGRADLRLEEGEEDVLEAGIEILAQPPGKRLAGVHLLSGGEKALSAIALLFAIFRYQPSPFCMLDEVDAALDDANVGRFTRMVSEYAKNTQFILVTHNKLSMESADLLYGVTMEEPGVSRLMSLQLQ